MTFALTKDGVPVETIEDADEALRALEAAEELAPDAKFEIDPPIYRATELPAKSATASAEKAEPETAPKAERTVAFFADADAASLLLTETVMQLIETHSIGRGLIDLAAYPGMHIASAFVKTGVPYDTIEFGQESHHGDRSADYKGTDAKYRAQASEQVNIEFSEIGAIDAEIVLIPKALGQYIDLGMNTLPGAIYTQCQERNRDILVVIPPERGMTRKGDDDYIRMMMHVGETARSADEVPASADRD